MNTKRANLWDTEARTRTPARSGCVSGRVRARLRVTDAVFKKSTSLPRKLSAIADLNPLRYVSAASSFWTAVAAVTKQVHFFVFQEQTREPQQSALGPFLNAFNAGFLQKTGLHVNTVLPQLHATEQEGCGAFIYDHSNREWLFFIPSLPCLWCCRVKNNCRTLSFTRFIFQYKYINI